MSNTSRNRDESTNNQEKRGVNIINNSAWVQNTDINRVSNETVISYWLKKEIEKEDCKNFRIDNLDTTQLLEKLFEYADGDTNGLWKYDNVHWYEKQLTKNEFQQINNISMPNGVGWDLVSNQKGVINSARRIIEGDITDSTTKYVDVDYIKKINDKLPEYDMKNLVIYQEAGLSPPRIIDGNHHATAVAMHYLQTGNLIPVSAYIGVRQISILTLLHKQITELMNKQIIPSIKGIQ